MGPTYDGETYGAEALFHQIVELQQQRPTQPTARAWWTSASRAAWWTGHLVLRLFVHVLGHDKIWSILE